MNFECLSIVIAGAGIGGLAAASLLADQGHHVTLYDQFSSPQPVGSGLVIQPVGIDVLARIGADERALALGNKISTMLGTETKRDREILRVSYGKDFGLAIHRAALFDALFSAARKRGIDIISSAKVVGRKRQRLVFEDGSTSDSPDLIVDALGAKSPLSPLRARPLPYGAIWGTVDWPNTDLPLDRLTQRYAKASKMAGVLPLGRLPNERAKKTAIFWSLPVDKYAQWRADGIDAWKDEAVTLWPQFAPFVEQVSHIDEMTFASYAHGVLKRPYGEGIVHIGDAAHRASPQLGQGANMALSDAHALTRALYTNPLPYALRDYALARRGHIRFYHWMSAIFTPQYQSDSAILPVIRDWMFSPLFAVPPVPQITQAIVSGTMLPPLGSLTPRA